MKKLQILIQTKEVLNMDAAHLSSVSTTGEKVHEGEGSQTEKLRETTLALCDPTLHRMNQIIFPHLQATVGYFWKAFP